MARLRLNLPFDILTKAVGAAQATDCAACEATPPAPTPSPAPDGQQLATANERGTRSRVIRPEHEDRDIG